MTIKEWKQAIAILKENPNIPFSEFQAKFDLTFTETKHLIRDVCFTWNIKRKGEKPKKYNKY